MAISVHVRVKAKTKGASGATRRAHAAYIEAGAAESSQSGDPPRHLPGRSGCPALHHELVKMRPFSLRNAFTNSIADIPLFHLSFRFKQVLLRNSGGGGLRRQEFSRLFRLAVRNQVTQN
jgi:hypothetical protein